MPQPKSDFKAQIQPLTSKFTFSTVTKETVLGKLGNLNECKATRPDRISAKLLRMVAPAISNSLTTLFNASLSQECFPTEWKEANVTPVPKSGDVLMITNLMITIYHRVPVLAKVLESIVHHATAI